MISHLYRDIAAGRPGTISRIGLHTFVDPRQDGGRINDVSTEALVELVELAGQELLFYKSFPIDVVLLRGTTADELGNVSMEREALTLDNLAMAMAARNSGGTVVVQVERIAAASSLPPRSVALPKVLVDAVVVAEPEHHLQTYATPYSEAYAHEVRLALDDLPTMPLSARKVVARRAAFELPVDGVVNLGIGMPEGSPRWPPRSGCSTGSPSRRSRGSSVASRPRAWTSVRPSIPTRLSIRTSSSTSTTAAAWTWPAWAWPSWTGWGT